jgi:hypothetical protein
VCVVASGQGLGVRGGLGLGFGLAHLQVGFEALQKRGFSRAAQAVGMAHGGGPFIGQLAVHRVLQLRGGLLR